MHLAAAMDLRYWVTTETPPNNYDHYPHKGITANVETISDIILNIRETYRTHQPRNGGQHKTAGGLHTLGGLDLRQASPEERDRRVSAVLLDP
jgi:hypothetical protein